MQPKHQETDMAPTLELLPDEPTHAKGGGQPVLNRRRMLAATVAGTLVAAFDPVNRRWVGEAEAGACREEEWRRIPRLQGTLSFDPAVRASDATDLGHLVERVPAAVLRPGCVEDIQKMVRFCSERNIEVAARGQHHTMFGQGLTSGLIIETQTLNAIHSVGPEGVDCDAGALWTDVLVAAAAVGLRPRGTPGFSGLSIGGTLSVGGCPTSFNQGALVDHVRELTVVTGEGDVRTCSSSKHTELFEAVLAGLGQFGIIVRAKIDLVPALPMARTYLIYYTDNSAFFSDLRALLGRGELNECFAVCVPPGLAPFVYQLNATVYYDPAAAPDDAWLLRDLTVPVAAAQVVDRPFLDNATAVDVQIAALRVAVDWDNLLKPWYDVWLPASEAESYVGATLPALTPLDLGAGGFILILPQRRSLMQRPLLRLPAASAGADGDWTFLFDILTTSMVPGADPAFADAMLARNRTLFEQARAVGGTRYPIGALIFNRHDWKTHYGNRWDNVRRSKSKFDPERILTPGPGIFK
jgi:cytokinin dehydrogenase